MFPFDWFLRILLLRYFVVFIIKIDCQKIDFLNVSNFRGLRFFKNMIYLKVRMNFISYTYFFSDRYFLIRYFLSSNVPSWCHFYAPNNGRVIIMIKITISGLRKLFWGAAAVQCQIHSCTRNVLQILHVYL